MFSFAAKAGWVVNLHSSSFRALANSALELRGQSLGEYIGNER